jgi:hypothetical protein
MTSPRKIKARYVASQTGRPLFLRGFDGMVRNSYILKRRRPVKATYSEAMEWTARVVGRPTPTVRLWVTKVRNHIVSTIFMTTSQGMPNTPPVVFETMWRHRKGGWQGGRRYYDYEKARAGHRDFVRHAAQYGVPE